MVDLICFDVSIGKCASLSGGCTLHVLERHRGGKRSVTNPHFLSTKPQNGNRCFFHAIAQYFLQKCGVESPSPAQLESFIAANICENVETPVAVKSIEAFERGNKHLDLGINVVFMGEDEEIFPCRPTPLLKADNMINLLLFFSPPLEGEEEGEPLLHYALIPDIQLVLRKRKQSETGINYTMKKFLCFNCFTSFFSVDALVNHADWCHKEKGQKITLPKQDETVRYHPKSKEFEMGYIFFYDFESMQVKPERPCSCPANSKKKCTHKTEIMGKHEAFSYCFLMIDRTGKVVEDRVYVGEDADEHFLNTLLEMEEKYLEKLDEVEPMVMTPGDLFMYECAEVCHICKQPFNERKREEESSDRERSDKVRDHDHLTGKFVGAAHNHCNLARRECKKLTGFCHNNSGFDLSFIMHAIGKRATKERDWDEESRSIHSLNAIPLNTQRFKVLQINQCTLLDSLAFLNDSLEKLVSTLVASNHQFPILRQWVKDENKLKLLLKKGTYCYEYIDSFEKVIEQRTALPPISEFYSHLSGKGVSEEDYSTAQTVWKEFGCKSLEDYTKVYVRSDTYQLAEALLELRGNIYQEFQIDLAHFFSLPHLAKDIMLKMTQVEMGLMSDPNMIHMIRSNIRGGLSYANIRHFSAEEERETKLQAIYVDQVRKKNNRGEIKHSLTALFPYFRTISTERR